MKTKAYIVTNEDGDEIELNLSQFEDYVIQSTELEGIPMIGEDGEPIEGAQPFSQRDTVKALMQIYEDGPDDGVWDDAPFDAYEKHFQFIDEALAESEVILRDRQKAKSAAKEEKARAKKEEEEGAAMLVASQKDFLEHAQKGTEAAADSYKDQLTSFKDTMPDGVTINPDTMSLVFDEGALTAGTLGETIGALYQGQVNADYLSDAMGWFMGDTMNACLEAGLYKSGIQAGKALVDMFSEHGIKSVSSGRLFERYGRVAREVPPEQRNKMVDFTAYLVVAEAASPKQNPEEKKSSYIERKEAHSSDKGLLYAALGEGGFKSGDKEISLKNRKDVASLVDDLQVKHEVKKLPDVNKKSKTELLTQFFFASELIEYWVAIAQKDEAGSIICQGKDGLITLSKADAATLLQEAKGELETLLFQSGGTKDSYGIAEIMAGTRSKKLTIIDEDEDGKKHPRKDEDGNKVYRMEETPTYIPLLVRDRDGTAYTAE